MTTRQLIAGFVAAFLGGALYEAGCVVWVHYAERDDVGPAVGTSMFNAVVTIIGVESFLKHWLFKVAYVLGFGTGTAVAILLRR